MIDWNEIYDGNEIEFRDGEEILCRHRIVRVDYQPLHFIQKGSPRQVIITAVSLDQQAYHPVTHKPISSEELYDYLLDFCDGKVPYESLRCGEIGSR